MKNGRWDLVKGVRDRLIEVKVTVIKGKTNSGLWQETT